MAKTRILTSAEHTAFETPPLFQLDEKMIYFEITDAVKKILDTFHSSSRKVGFLLQLGYFRRVGRFFSTAVYHADDITFVANVLGQDQRTFNINTYSNNRYLSDQETILALHGFQSFDNNASAQSLLTEEVTALVTKQIRPKTIIYYLSIFFFHKKIEMPSYAKLAMAITQALNHFETHLLETLKKNLTPLQTNTLDKLLPKITKNKALKKESHYARAPLIALRNIPLSARPKKIAKSIQGFQEIKKLFDLIKPALQPLALSPSSLKYYGVWVNKARITQLMQIANANKRYLYLIAFIAHQYYCRQDLLVDTLLQVVQSALHAIKKKQKEENEKIQKEKDHATKILSTSYRDKAEILTKIQSIIHTDTLSAEEKITQIKSLIGAECPLDPSIVACIEKLDQQINSSLQQDDYYDAIEQQSASLQKRISSILKHIDFNPLNSKATLLEAINHFRTTNGAIGKNPPCDFLDQQDKTHLSEKRQFRVSLYKALLFIKTTGAIKSGELNLLSSYRYLSINEYLIKPEAWSKNRKDYLLRAGLESYSSVENTLTPLKKILDEHYQKTNENLENGTNIHVTFNKEGEIIINTPKVEKADTLRVSALLMQKNYVSILDLLMSIDQVADFTSSFQHYSVQQKIKRPEDILFYAGLIGKGCNIGIPKLARVSKGLNGNTLETVVNWYFTHDNIMTANNRIIQLINKLALPNLMQRIHGKLHTSSDGQKRNVDIESILANFSFKYHGSGSGVSIYDFIDERHVLFHSLVMSSSEREAAYVIDGLLCNDEIKSDIHSTDTHGYSDLIFAITHLLGISFAPRLAKLKKRSLYAFESKKTYREKGYQILPDYTINIALIEENWDDILRLVASIKLKESNASQILKRLSSYAKHNPLYQGLKEFGKLIKSIFILTYIDDLPLRQAIQKQLNKIELANKFSSAIFFDNNQEFKHGTREEQETTTLCKILLQNAVVLWNYLYLSQLLATSSSVKQAELLKIIKNGSVMVWLHLNLLGEYDFRAKKASNSAVFNLEKIMAWRAK